MTKAGGRLVLVAVALLAASLPSWAQSRGGPAVAMDGAWHFTIAPYAWFSGISGDISVANLAEIPVEATFSDMIEDVDVGLQLHFEGRKDRLGFGVDVFYVDLGVPVEADAPPLAEASLEADMRQLLAEGLFFYRAVTGGRGDTPGYLDLIAGARYTDSRSRLTATSQAGAEYDGEFQDLGWVDAVLGVRGAAPLGSRFMLLGWGDLAGLGSELTWNLEGDVAYLASEHWVVGLGWRHMDIDYDEGEGLDRQVFEIAYDGPRLWFAYLW